MFILSILIYIGCDAGKPAEIQRTQKPEYEDNANSIRSVAAVRGVIGVACRGAGDIDCLINIEIAQILMKPRITGLLHCYRKIKCGAVLLIALGANWAYGQGTMISVSGPPGDGQASPVFVVNQMAGTSWIQTAAFSNVNISVSFGADSGAAGMAYLTTRIGPGTTVNDEVASASFAFPSTSSMVSVLSGLTLGDGTYYLSIEETAQGSAAYGVWNGAQFPNLVTAANVIANGTYYASYLVEGYAPAAADGESTLSFVTYSVTGTPVPTPEPSTICLFALGGGMGILALRRKRKGAA